MKEENCIFPGWLTNRKRDQGVLAFLAEPAVDAVVSAKEKEKADQPLKSEVHINLPGTSLAKL